MGSSRKLICAETLGLNGVLIFHSKSPNLGYGCAGLDKWLQKVSALGDIFLWFCCCSNCVRV